MKKINISQVDTIFTNGIYPIEFLLYYKDGIETKSVRSALDTLSSVFWPIFGEYDAGAIHFDRYYEKDCFDEEVIDQEFDKEETNKNIYGKYCRVNQADLKKLFFLKVIQYRNGTLLIPKMNHLAGDGYSYFYFLSALAEVSQATYSRLKKNLTGDLYEPKHQRTILKEFQLSEFNHELLQYKEELTDEFTIEFEEIPKSAIRSIINNVASDFNRQVSSNDILSAMVIKKLVGCQKECLGEDFQLTMPIDVRRQIKEYGPRFFGNGIMFNPINFKSRYIEKSSINEIAIEIRKYMPCITKESYIEYLAGIESIIARGQTNKLKPFNPEFGCLVTNLSMLPATKLNFGTGHPDFLFPLTIEKNSAAILSDKDNYILRLAY